MTTNPILADRSTELGLYCTGVLPLHARIEPWMQSLLTHQGLPALLATHGSPLNVHCMAPMQRNIDQLDAVASDRDLDFRVYFARKANKCLSPVDTALVSGAGIDTASENELQQALERGAPSHDLICTAAVKDQQLLSLCVSNRITVVVDNRDELLRVAGIAKEQGSIAQIAIRLSGFTHRGIKLRSRFGFDIDSLESETANLMNPCLQLVGLQFHLDGYSNDQRVSAIIECLPLIDSLRRRGHSVGFLDIGGGFPTNYLQSANEWHAFWEALRAALLGKRPPITYENHGIGQIAIDGKLHGKINSYPYYQSLEGPEWLAKILDSPAADGTIADEIRSRHLQLRCEPGRRLMDGCGMTIARVEFRKQNGDGDWLIGLSMNRTQCRTSSDDFLVDPILIPGGGLRTGLNPADEAIEGYLVGAYCTEFEFISLRKLIFPSGVQIGDLIAFPNTAGYLMHFMESRSHQFPLAQNLVFSDDLASSFIDDISFKQGSSTPGMGILSLPSSATG